MNDFRESLKLYWRASHEGGFRQMIQFSACVVELRKEKHVKYDENITMDSPSREFLEVTFRQSGALYLAITASAILRPSAAALVIPPA